MATHTIMKREGSEEPGKTKKCISAAPAFDEDMQLSAMSTSRKASSVKIFIWRDDPKAMMYASTTGASTSLL